MPADGYSFRPVPEEMSFGEIMAHIATADRGACAVASGLTAPEIPAKLSAWLKDPGKVDVDKDTDLRFINETFAFCGKAIDEMPANRANTVVGTASRNLTGRNGSGPTSLTPRTIAARPKSTCGSKASSRRSTNFDRDRSQN